MFAWIRVWSDRRRRNLLRNLDGLIGFQYEGCMARVSYAVVLMVLLGHLLPALAGKTSREICEEQAHARCNRCHDDCAKRHGDPKKNNHGGGWPHAVCKRKCNEVLLKEMAACK